MNQQKLQMAMLCLRSIYASMTFNCPLMLNKVGSEKIPLPQAHMLFRCAVYRDSYLDTNPKIAIYHDPVFRGNTTPSHSYVFYGRFLKSRHRIFFVG